MIAPPQKSLGTAANLICLSLILLGLSAWLPAHWFTSPSWRSILEGNFGVALPASRSPQPWLTLEANFLLWGNLAWAYLMFTHFWSQNTRGAAVRIFCAGILALTALALGSYWSGHKIPLWPRVLNSTVDFGFFVNRNQTANVLALTGILLAALAFDELRGGRKRAAFWFGGIAMMGVALVIA